MEQAAIARYLDHIDRRIQRYVATKRKLIALLNEEKQAIINRAVTRGLDPNVRLRPSGVEWLGDVPKHWATRKVKFLVSACGGMTPSKSDVTYWNGTIPWVSPKDMKVRELTDSEDHITEAALSDTGITLIHPAAVLIVVRGMILARKFPVAITKVPTTINQDMKALVPRAELHPDFLVRLLEGIQKELLGLVEESGHGTRCLRTDSWENLIVPLPPLSEQRTIVEQLRGELHSLEAKVNYAQKEIALIGEYRTRLIADVVTGKLDVREAAANLPQEVGEEDQDLDEESQEAEDMVDGREQEPRQDEK